MLPLVDQQRQGRTAERENKGRGVTLFLQNQVKVPTKSVQSFLRLASTNRQADRSKMKFYICKLTGCVLLEDKLLETRMGLNMLCGMWTLLSFNFKWLENLKHEMPYPFRILPI